VITTGEGGMIVFKSKKHAVLAEGLRNQGRFKRTDYKNKVVGTNFRMSNLQAAVGVAQLKKINIFLKKRKRIFELYDKFFQNVKNISLLPKNNWSQNSYWLYTILLNNYGEKKRDKIIRSLLKVGIE
jgi:perosamine synthetase